MFLRVIQLVGFLVFFIVWFPLTAISFVLCAVLSLTRVDLVYYHIVHGRWPTDEEHRKIDDEFFEGFTITASIPVLLFFGFSKRKKKHVI